MNWFSWFQLLAPVVLQSIPALRAHPAVQTAILTGVPEAAAIAGATNEDKKAHVLNLVAAAVPAVDDITKRDIDTTEVTAAASSAIDTTIGVINLIHAAHGDGTPNQANPPAAAKN